MRGARALAIGAAVAAGCLVPAGALGATITVTTTADASVADAACSLREAVTAAVLDSAAGGCAAGAPGTDTIVLGAGTYRLSLAGPGDDLNATGDIDIRSPVTIVGAGAGATTIDGGRIDRVIDVIGLPGVAVTIDGVTVTGGAAPPGAGGAAGAVGGDGESGGGIRAAGPLSLVGARVSGNDGGAGGGGGNATGAAGVAATGGAGGRGGAGGIASTGALSLAGSVVAGNRGGAGGAGGAGTGGTGGATGTGGAGGRGGAGGIDAAGTATIATSQVVDNVSGAGGAGGAGTGGSGGIPGQPGGSGTGGRGGDAGAGGGVLAAGTVRVERSTISRNLTGTGGAGGAGDGDFGASGGPRGAGIGGAGGAGGDGGGVALTAGGHAISDATLTANATGPGGAGGRVEAGSAASPGSAPGAPGGGGLGGGVAARAPAALTHLTIASNRTGDPASPASGLLSDGGLTLAASIVSGNGCAGAIGDGGGGVASAAPGCPGAAGDPVLGPPAANGGPTPTLRPGAGGRAIDAVPAGPLCAGADQRGVPRVPGAPCDAGAVELAPPVAATGAAAGVTARTARLGGSVDTRALGATYRVEIGTTTAYGFTTAEVALPPLAGPAPTTTAVANLAPRTTYHYRLVATGPDGTTVGADRIFTTRAAGAAAAGARPRVRGLSIAPGAFAVGRPGAAPRGRTRTRAAVGALIRVRLSTRASLRIQVQRRVPGRVVLPRSGAVRCVPVKARASMIKRRCVAVRTMGTITRRGKAGLNRIRFSGRVGGRALAPGRYRLVVTASASGRRSSPLSKSFRVVGPRR